MEMIRVQNKPDVSTHRPGVCELDRREEQHCKRAEDGTSCHASATMTLTTDRGGWPSHGVMSPPKSKKLNKKTSTKTSPLLPKTTRFWRSIFTSTRALAMATNEVEEAVKRINSHKGVLGILIVNTDGIPIKTTLEPAETVQLGALVTHFAKKTRGVIQQLDPENELTFVRVRSKKHEILIAPDDDYTLVVLQNPQ